MNFDNETIQECIDKYEKEGLVAIIKDGKVIDHVLEK